ncbi:anti-sigma factor antagonist [Nostoc sp. PCC 7107]|uniref:anti-sigma factor antagonist n=1 Tax=Nostoc sp. PCC 7107 TaxID=317936 RepID=UPI00029EFBEB|nr:anti-sigma factor antagonist [Nostoc sp. PCC 7107]AFY43772.1 anti-anti-sigma factor [Nostoc sp. PCC 7107]
MSFHTTLKINQRTAIITLLGELDANSAPLFQKEIEKTVAVNPDKLVLMMQKLDYMSSAGLRVLIFAKQKMGANVDICMVGLQEQVIDTLNKTGCNQGVILLDEYVEEQVFSS